ncbi:MAG: hypothetical protein WC364_14885, partial [Eubacteriales bacterium]
MDKATRQPTHRKSVLVRLLYENTEPTEKGYQENRETYPDRIISAVDPEARHGAKSKTKTLNGYKTHVTETVENKFITNIVSGRRFPACRQTGLAALFAQAFSPGKAITGRGFTAVPAV